MWSPLLSSLSVLLIAGHALGAPSCPRGDKPSADDRKYLISFGDSYSSNAFNISAAKPSGVNPIGNPDLPGKTTSGWLNWLGLLTLGYNKTLVLNYDFAKGGATVNNSIVKSNNRPDFADQVAEFKGSIGSKPDYAKWTSDNALFAVWFGINDIGLSYAQGGENARIDKVHNSYFKNLDALYKAGARNFVILTIPPTDRTPLMKGRSNVDKLISAKKYWNGNLPKRFDDFKSKHAGVKITFIDTHPPFNKALDHPKDYGAPDANCEDQGGFKCLWYNNYHPGVAIHNLTAGVVAGKIDSFFTATAHAINIPKA